MEANASPTKAAVYPNGYEMTSVILSASSGNSLNPLSINAYYNEVPLEHKEFRVETTKYRELVHLSVLYLLPPHLLGGPNMILEVEVLEPLGVDSLARNPRLDGGKGRVWTEPVVPSPCMLLVVKRRRRGLKVLQSQRTPGMNAPPLVTPAARRLALSISSGTAF